MHGTVGPMFAMTTPVSLHHHQGTDGMTEKKKKKEEKDREKREKEKDKVKSIFLSTELLVMAPLTLVFCGSLTTYKHGFVWMIHIFTRKYVIYFFVNLPHPLFLSFPLILAQEKEHISISGVLQGVQS